MAEAKAAGQVRFLARYTHGQGSGNAWARVNVHAGPILGRPEDF